MAAFGFFGWFVVFFPPPQAVAGVIAAITSNAITHTLNRVFFIQKNNKKSGRSHSLTKSSKKKKKKGAKNDWVVLGDEMKGRAAAHFKGVK